MATFVIAGVKSVVATVEPADVGPVLSTKAFIDDDLYEA